MVLKQQKIKQCHLPTKLSKKPRKITVAKNPKKMKKLAFIFYENMATTCTNYLHYLGLSNNEVLSVTKFKP